MSMIINKTDKSFEKQSHRTYPENWNGDGWIPVPPELETVVLENAPYYNLEIEDGILVGVTPTEKPDPESIPTDHEILMTLLGVTE